jgi:Flp pilus assembly protein TadB
MRRITDPNEIERELKKGGMVVTWKSLAAVMVAAMLIAFLVNLAGLRRWPMYGVLLVAVFVTTYIVASRAGKNK